MGITMLLRRFLISPLDYFFYRMYVWQLKQWNLDGLAKDIAGSEVGLFVGFNLITVVSVVLALTKWYWLRFWDASNISVAIFVIAWTSIYSRLYKARADAIISRCSAESAAEWKAKTPFIWGYQIVTFAIAIGAIVWASSANP